MEPEYIVAISVGGLYLLIFFIYIIVACKKQKREKALNSRLAAAYSDEELVKMEYDFAVYDEETSRMLSGGKPAGERQVTIDDVLSGSEPDDAAVFGKIETEGMEEITGNYKPD